MRHSGVLGRLKELLAVPHILGPLEGRAQTQPTTLRPAALPWSLPWPWSESLTWCFASHSCTRLRPSSLVPFWVVSLGYSGSGVPLGNMNLRPPPRITCSQRTWAGGLGAEGLLPLLTDSPQLPIRSVEGPGLYLLYSILPKRPRQAAGFGQLDAWTLASPVLPFDDTTPLAFELTSMSMLEMSCVAMSWQPSCSAEAGMLASEYQLRFTVCA